MANNFSRRRHFGFYRLHHRLVNRTNAVFSFVFDDLYFFDRTRARLSRRFDDAVCDGRALGFDFAPSAFCGEFDFTAFGNFVRADFIRVAESLHLDGCSDCRGGRGFTEKAGLFERAVFYRPIHILFCRLDFNHIFSQCLGAKTAGFGRQSEISMAARTLERLGNVFGRNHDVARRR